MGSAAPTHDALGFDFGTTNSVAAVSNDAQHSALLPLNGPDGASPVFRSALCLWEEPEAKDGLAHEAGPWAIAEFLHEHPSKPKTLFATHYHELNEMSESLPRIQNYNVSVKELKDTVLFIRKLVKGGSAHSFGIHVAKMAGMPQIVILKAQKLLKKLEKDHSSEALSGIKSAKDEMQMSFFNLDDPLLEEIKDEILSLDINTITPMEALMKLNEIKRMLTKK